MAKFCSNCGTKLKEGADVCLGCGKAIEKDKNLKTNSNGTNNKFWVLFSFLGIIQIVFMTLKLCNVISWDWPIVFLPVLIPIFIFIFCFIILIIVNK